MLTTESISITDQKSIIFRVMVRFKTLAFLTILGLGLLLGQSCTYTIKVRDGDTAFDRKQYAKAIPYFTKDYQREKSRVKKGRIALKLAESYQRINEPERALYWYKIGWDNQAGIQALEGYAYTLKMLERYPDATDAFVQLGEEIGSTYEYRNEIESCRLAETWLKDSTKSPYVLSPASMNSRYGDYAPSLAPRGGIIYSSERPSPQSADLYAWTGKPYADILVTEDAGQALPESLIDKINTKAHEANLIFSGDGRSLFFTRCGGLPETEDQYCRILQSRFDGAEWSDPQVLPFCTGTINFGHAVPNIDGSRILFASDDPLGFGGFDLYESQRTADGWSEPAILPPNVNTDRDDLFPNLDGDTLYFASEGHLGMGGLDIFRSVRQGPRAWTTPVNMKVPINSGADDFGLIWMPVSGGNALRQGYLCSSRPGGLGGDDIYKVSERIVPLPPPPPMAQEPSYTWKLRVHILTRIRQDPTDPNSPVLGRRYLEGAKVKVTGGLDTAYLSPRDESALLDILPGKNYLIQASSPDYLSTAVNFSARDLVPDPGQPEQVFEIEVILDKRYVNQEIVLENIYYDFDRWEIREDAQPALTRLARLLTANPELSIELGSHTDCRGNTLYNQDLSQKRAQSAVEFLIQNGIDARRLRARGYGESRPAADCACARCTEQEHQQNRRTTFRILQE